MRVILLCSMAILLSQPLLAKPAERLEARAIFDQPIPIGSVVATTAPVAAQKGLVLSEQAYELTQKTLATTMEMVIEGQRKMTLPAGTPFGAWSFDGETRLCRIDRARGFIEKSDFFVCLRDLDGDQRAEKAVTWPLQLPRTGSEFAIAAPPAMVVAAPSKAEVNQYLDGHRHRIAMRLRVASVSGKAAKLQWQLLVARPGQADLVDAWPDYSVQKASVTAGGPLVVLGPWTIASTSGSDGRPLLSVVETRPWITVAGSGTAIYVTDTRFDRVFNWPADPCQSVGAKLMTTGPATNFLNRALVRAVAGCDPQGAVLFTEWERDSLGQGLVGPPPAP